MVVDRAFLRRLGACFFAVAIAVGSVAVMRIVAREIAGFGSAKGRVQTMARLEPASNAPRVFDLATLVPKDLQYTILGRACSRREIPLLMPRVLAIKVKENEAASAGWKLLHETGRHLEIWREKNMSSIYETPTVRIISRKFYGTGPDTTTMVEIELPDLKDFAMVPGGENASEGLEPSISEIAALQSVAVRHRLPSVFAEIVIGQPLFTVLERHTDGSVFNVTTIEMGPQEAIERRIAELLVKNGWALLDQKVRVAYIRENLTLGFHCGVDLEQPGATVVSYRISDDEVRVKTKRSENENG